MSTLLDIRDLEVRFPLKEGTVYAVNGVSLSIPPGRTVGLVGESGCGKSITARAAMRILEAPGEITRGSIRLEGITEDLTQLDPDSPKLRQIRGGEISMIFQEPMTSFSPVHTVGNQIGECVRLHQRVSRAEERKRVIDMLRLVGVPMPEKRLHAYPHELSGGLRQRCMIAMALCCRPRLLIADEPTTALDVTIQEQILRLLKDLQSQFNMAVLMITHDLGVIAQTADEVAVMYLGRIVEYADVKSLFASPMHPYTQGLLASVPRMGRGNAERLASVPGSVPHPFERVTGCPFHPRCPEAMAGTCDLGDPPVLQEVAGGRTSSHRVACHLYGNRDETERSHE
jgi:peptide/nickel transport system ATP-binding protein